MASLEDSGVWGFLLLEALMDYLSGRLWGYLR